jgi:anti-sigma regulatory factor (Ser/Thr protein kinase)
MIKDQLVVDANLENIPRIRDFVARLCVEAGATHDECFALKLAVDEACTNIIEHGYGEAGHGDISIAVSFEDGQARVVVSDTGRPFAPADAPPPDLDADWSERPVGGLGWHLIRNLVDDHRYQRRDDRNRLTLIKQLSGERGTLSGDRGTRTE